MVWTAVVGSLMAGESALMDPVDILIWLVIGAVAGWLAGQLIRGGGLGLIGDIVVGIAPLREQRVRRAFGAACRQYRSPAH